VATFTPTHTPWDCGAPGWPPSPPSPPHGTMGVQGALLPHPRGLWGSRVATFTPPTPQGTVRVRGGHLHTLPWEPGCPDGHPAPHPGCTTAGTQGSPGEVGGGPFPPTPGWWAPEGGGLTWGGRGQAGGGHQGLQQDAVLLPQPAEPGTHRPRHRRALRLPVGAAGARPTPPPPRRPHHHLRGPPRHRHHPNTHPDARHPGPPH